MDIKITDKSLRKFLSTKTSTEEIAAKVSLCGPTFDRIHQKEDDYILEIEAITNRIDTASAQGVAREAVAILNQFDLQAEMINDPYQVKLDKHSHLPQNFKIIFEPKDLVRRFMAVSFSGVKIHPSPDDTVSLLESSDQRSINNAVDITNELTLLYGMPSHIFDLDKIGGKSLYIRESKSNEQVSTLDGTTNKLRGNDIVIEDGDQKLIDLCGIMGGSEAEVDSQTTNILLIVPVYQPKRIRKTSLYLQKRTLASQIYEKTPDTKLCESVLAEAIELFNKRAEASVSSSVFDYYPEQLDIKTVEIDLDWLHSFVGVDIDEKKVITILNDLGFSGQKVSDKVLSCTVPSYRYFDINIKEDLAEEIARVYGYFRLPGTLPNVNLLSEEDDKVLINELKTKKYIAALGFSEIFNNSLTSLVTLEKAKQNPKDCLKLANALSSDFEYLRTSLLPSLLNNLANNTGKVDLPINIFELSNTYKKRSKGSIPDEISTLAIVSTNDYLFTKGIIESLLIQLNVSEIKFSKTDRHALPVFDQNKTAKISSGDTVIGYIGQLDPLVANNFSINSPTTVVEINFQLLVGLINPFLTYTPISSYANVVEDITLDSDQPIGPLIEAIKTSSKQISKVTYLSSYKNSHTFKVIFSDLSKPLNQTEVNKIKEELFLKIKELG